MKRAALLLVLAASLLLVGNALAMRSTNYWLDWYTPLTGGGGGAAGSTNYAVNFTVGQTASGASTSTNYRGCLGYWCGEVEYQILLPLVLRDYSPP